MFFNTWNFVTEFPEGCKHPELPADDTGLQVLVAGLGKTGTRTISHALNDIGIRSYHSEDFHFWTMWDWAQREWTRRNATPDSWESMGALINTYPKGRETLATAVSKCRVGAIALDGLENFLEPLRELSPNAKVILLNWRTFLEHQKSMFVFYFKLRLMCTYTVYLSSSLCVLPWGALLRLLDPFVGKPLETWIGEGGPPLTEVNGPMAYTYHQMINYRRQYAAWLMMPSTQLGLPNEAVFDKWHNDIKASVPADKLIEWDHRKNTFEDLCRFTGVAPCPKSGRLPRAINTWIFERDFPIAGILNSTVKLFFHWVNWKLVCGLWGFFSRLFCGRSKKSHEKRD